MFIEPCWLGSCESSVKLLYLDQLKHAEGTYLDLVKGKTTVYKIKAGESEERAFTPWTPQQARSVLPNSLKTEVCMTGFESDWGHFFELRCAQAAHPQMRELAIPLQETFKTL